MMPSVHIPMPIPEDDDAASIKSGDSGFAPPMGSRYERRRPTLFDILKSTVAPGSTKSSESDDDVTVSDFRKMIVPHAQVN